MINKIPLAQWIDSGVDWMQSAWGDSLDGFSSFAGDLIQGATDGLLLMPWWLIMLILVAISYKASSWKLSLGTFLGIFLVWNLQLWEPFVSTMVLVILSALVSALIGLPLGVLSGKKDGFHATIMPILDFMQTMPSFVYLIPALLLFGIGQVPAIFATVIFAMPPVIRLTDLGIRQVPIDLIEVGEAFGCNPMQLLGKIQIPLAIPTIMAGINQTMMLALSMVVISAMIGAGGLGAGVLTAIGRVENGMGFEYGIAVVVMAIIFDRILQGIGRKLQVEHKINKK